MDLSTKILAEKLCRNFCHEALGDALDGDPTMYARRDAVEESWRIVDEARCAAAPVHLYDEGTWGPKEAERVSPEGGFTNPEV